MSDEKKSFFARLTPHSWTVLFLCVVLTINTVSHISSPAYNSYRELGQSLRDEIRDKFLLLDQAHSNFCSRVELEFIPHINELMKTVAAKQSIDSQVFSSESSREVSEKVSDFLDISASYNYIYCRVGSDYESGAYINGWFFRKGDTYFGRRILEICPECAILDRGIIRPRDDPSGLNSQSVELSKL